MHLNPAGKMVEKWYYELENKYPDITCGEMVVMPNHFHCIIIIVRDDLCVDPDLSVAPSDDLSVDPDGHSAASPDPGVRVDLCVNPSDDLCVNPDVHPDLSVNPSDELRIAPDADPDLPIYPTDSNTTKPTVSEPNGVMGEHIGSPQPDASPQPNASSQPDASPQPQTQPIGSSQKQPNGTSLHSVIQWFKTMTTNEYIRNVKSNNWQRFDGKLWQRNYWEHIIRNDKSHERISEYIKNNPLNWEKDKLKK
jgi:REP element-mobilizing transposase RayT